jgi:hypothetical protein
MEAALFFEMFKETYHFTDVRTQKTNRLNKGLDCQQRGIVAQNL